VWFFSNFLLHKTSVLVFLCQILPSLCSLFKRQFLLLQRRDPLTATDYSPGICEQSYVNMREAQNASAPCLNIHRLSQCNFVRGICPKRMVTVDSYRSTIKLEVLRNLKLCVSIFLKTKSHISDWRIAQNINSIKIFRFYVKQLSSK
jgi:hypothetical protein